MKRGGNLAMTRLYGWAPRGKRVIGAVTQNYGANVTMLGVLSMQGNQSMMTVEGATDADVFLAYVEHVRAPTLRPGDLVVLDNLRGPKVAGVQQAVAGRGARLIDCPRIRRTCHPSSSAGRSSRPTCAKSRRALVRPLSLPSHNSWKPSQPRMPMGGSVIVVMTYSNAKTALDKGGSYSIVGVAGNGAGASRLLEFISM
jgi:hypothetical protein